MINLRRQVAALLAENEQASVSDGQYYPYRLFDVLPKIVLQLEEGKFTQNSISLGSAQSYSVPLPQDYDPTKRLYVTIRSNAILKAVWSDGTTTSTHLIKGTDSADDGYHPGVLMFQDILASLTLSVVSGGDTAFVEYMLWEIPDLDDPLSYRIGNLAFGFVVGNE